MAHWDTDTRELVAISGRGTLVNIRVDDGAPIKIACRTLREHLGRDRNLYSCGEVMVDIGRRILSQDEQERIRKVIDSESGLVVKQFWCDPTILAEERDRIDGLMRSQVAIYHKLNVDESPVLAGRAVPKGLNPQLNGEDPSPADTTCGEDRGVVAQVSRGTHRAGEVQRFSGNVVVVGNVNPGAQIIARGDILVFGKLRGLAHAGVDGDPTAVILAMSYDNPQLRIADQVWDPDTGRPARERGIAGPEHGPIIARIRNRSVHVSPFLKNHSIDHGGNPNER